MSRNPWADYWSSSRPGPGCLPDADQSIGPLLDRQWREFASMLPRRARILDLATGDGAVPRKLRAARPDLDLVGVDSSPLPPRSGEGFKLQGGVAMEKLGFREGSFDAVTSQFGVEYGDVPAIAAQVARILKAGGLLRFIVHHSDSPVLAHNLARRAALVWAAQDSLLIDKAKKLAAARALAPLPTPASFRQAIAEAQTLHPGQPVAAEFVAAIVQTLDAGPARPPRETIQSLTALAERAQDEIGRIDALRAAVRDEPAIRQLRTDLEGCGLQMELAGELRDPVAGSAFAWVIDGQKPVSPV